MPIRRYSRSSGSSIRSRRRSSTATDDALQDDRAGRRLRAADERAARLHVGSDLFPRDLPLDLNLDRTPVNDAPEDYIPDSKNSLQYYVRVDWGSDGIGDIAKKYGFSRVDYADLEILTVFGVWSQERVHLYGERRNP
jgi:hypothetical protein